MISALNHDRSRPLRLSVIKLRTIGQVYKNYISDNKKNLWSATEINFVFLTSSRVLISDFNLNLASTCSYCKSMVLGTGNCILKKAI